MNLEDQHDELQKLQILIKRARILSINDKGEFVTKNGVISRRSNG